MQQPLQLCAPCALLEPCLDQPAVPVNVSVLQEAQRAGHQEAADFLQQQIDEQQQRQQQQQEAAAPGSSLQQSSRTA